MSEENLKYISVTDLIDLMVVSVNELIVLHKKHDYLNMGSKNKEVQLIQKVIASKRAQIFN